MEFSRPDEEELTTRPFELGSAIRDLGRILQRLLRSEHTLHFILTDEPLVVQGRASSLSRVLTNLVLNARDASPHGGNIRVSLDAQTIAYTELPPLLPGRYARIRVEDEGVGIAPEDLDRVFEPFFTTKASGKGTGLGLASVFGIVRHMGGHVRVESELAAGARFDVFLPVVDRGCVAEKQRSPHRPLGGEVLVVDDDESIRGFVARALRRRGFGVREADGAYEGMAVINEQRPTIVLSDLLMPQGSGSELAAWMKIHVPDVPLVLMSGFAPEAQVQELGAHPFLEKPFSLEQLIETVEKALDRQAS